MRLSGSSEASLRRKRLDRGIKARADTIFAVASYREILYLLLPKSKVGKMLRKEMRAEEQRKLTSQ